MGSTEDPMDTSSDTLSPSITLTLNSLRTHDESPPLTPVPHHADISLSTHYGTSSPPSPEWTLVSHQHVQQIQSQFDQLSHHQTSATTDNLVEDADDLGAILLSLASIEQALFPHKRISSLIKESKEKPLLLFIVDKLYQLRKKLQIPDQYLQGEIKHLKEYITELQNECRKYGETAVIHSITAATESPFLVVLARLKDKRPDIEPINYHRVTRTEFAIILGCILGSMGYYINPNYGHTHSQMLKIGTAVACGAVKARKPLEVQ
ncbi:hypothetical protein FOCG_16327 [Fusarium oxysporum f. sp. radicis-lycopersici 26381]|uniref:Uncharacterized protein n=1 Tax=Fusarium oxysporum NRRL 32931 TaxID=660029 RepID=W9IXP3_FUSOX|nr:hypothetical protein FOYG_02264 [Fusarium oxysporum NRRL 32931]EXL41523.1 hypothetical protein FOCG_16327 [Fusarium oxysporum f. sp. radicis-lycopersici 26381]